MAKAITIVAAAIPAAVAVLFAAALLGTDTIPFSASGPNDRMHIEYTIHEVRTVRHGVTENAASVSSQVLTLREDGSVTYTRASVSGKSPTVSYSVGENGADRIKALVKETGFFSINAKFPVSEQVTEYDVHSVKLNLNGKVSKLRWPEQNATDAFIPPVITAVEEELGKIISMMP